MENPLLSQGRVQAATRHGRLLWPAAAMLLQAIVADMVATLSGH